MGLFKIEWKPSVEHDLKRLDKQYIPKIIQRIESLVHNPLPHASKKLLFTEKTYRIRVGDYRVIYQVDYREKTVLINYIRHRKDVYKIR